MNRGFGHNQADRWNTAKRNNSEEVKMTRIKIRDLPKDMKIGKDEMKQIFGGLVVSKYIGETEKNLSDSLDTRQYTAISNVMKTMLDTDKASIDNTR